MTATASSGGESSSLAARRTRLTVARELLDECADLRRRVEGEALVELGSGRRVVLVVVGGDHPEEAVRIRVRRVELGRSRQLVARRRDGGGAQLLVRPTRADEQEPGAVRHCLRMVGPLIEHLLVALLRRADVRAEERPRLGEEDGDVVGCAAGDLLPGLALA